MYIDVQVQSRINDNDIIIFRDGKWTTVHKGQFLGEVMAIMNKKETHLKKENENLAKEIESLKVEIKKRDEHIAAFEKAINERLKEHHNVLNALTGAKK